MKKRKQSGQAFILVIILLGLAAALLGPVMRFSSTTLLSSMVIDQKTKQLYAADAGQEYVIWKLLYQDYASEFDEDGETKTISLDINGVPVEMTVVMRALVGVGTTMYDARYAIKPSKTVAPIIGDTSLRDYTYTIKLENLTLEEQILERVYDVLPSNDFDGAYVPGSSQIRVDGGAWEPFPDPLREDYPQGYRLCWPASGNFDSPVKDFAPGQVKEIKFVARAALKDNTTYYNWVVLQPGAVASGPVAPLKTGTGAGPDGGGVVVQKTATPQLAIPGVENDVEYVITITNLSKNTLDVASVTDYLPPEFYYVGGSTTGNLTTQNPAENLGDYNGVTRWRLLWGDIPSQNKSIASGGSKTLDFWARTTPNVSGAYYNEVMVELANFSIGSIFTDIGVTQLNSSPFSWNSGVVIVPAYDSRAEADDTTIDASLGLTLDNITVNSWVGY